MSSDDDEALPAGKKTVMKIDMTRDLLTIFSERVTVKFVDEDGSVEEDGRWCNICRYVLHCWP